MRLNQTFSERFDFEYRAKNNSDAVPVKISAVLSYDSQRDTYDITMSSKKSLTEFAHTFTGIKIVAPDAFGGNNKPTDHAAEIDGKRIKFTVVEFGERVHVFSGVSLKAG